MSKLCFEATTKESDICVCVDKLRKAKLLLFTKTFLFRYYLQKLNERKPQSNYLMPLETKDTGSEVFVLQKLTLCALQAVLVYIFSLTLVLPDGPQFNVLFIHLSASHICENGHFVDEIINTAAILQQFCEHSGPNGEKHLEPKRSFCSNFNPALPALLAFDVFLVFLA